MRTFSTITAGAVLTVMAAATVGLATAHAETVSPPPTTAAPAHTPLSDQLEPFLHPVGFTECVNAIGEGVGTGALTGFIGTIEAGGAGALPSGVAGGIVGGLKNC